MAGTLRLLFSASAAALLLSGCVMEGALPGSLGLPTTVNQATTPDALQDATGGPMNALIGRYAAMYENYVEACRRRKLTVGRVHVYFSTAHHKMIINVPTKEMWANPSTLEIVSAGIEALAAEIKHQRIQSVAIPMLGCGLGGLSWPIVRAILLTALDKAQFEHRPLIELYEGS